ncbi:hypothetical protein SNOG_16248 [Parastagonospora nodorum SN15]|uniref:Protein kinase domain-containing protein n=1 Tax=Phaeosphaeria nodorum (strain SN15 / ATCC MYA-4574 / FGSC 10173) TaxID=321614 RepID=Q0TWC2_PHANO|nr:hypothetical protein SNOG_16248 [Parastagonospora nodorum SN15]EAT76432.2 hypothetical protein SNOG_16248 [Parastagonospora nodorum SN15]
MIKMEIILHSHLKKHPHIIHCLGSGEDTLWTWIAMELAEGGDLFDKIEADEGVGVDIAHFYFSQLVSAVRYMHSQNQLLRTGVRVVVGHILSALLKTLFRVESTICWH